MDFKDIIYEKKKGVAKIIINRPKAYNAFTNNTLKEMTLAFEDAEQDFPIRVAVLRGYGDKAFCTGGDANEEAEGGYKKEMEYWHNRLHHAIRNMSKPVIAAVNGYAIGGGHVLHVLCDITIASENAKFAQFGPKVGSFDAGFGTAYLSRIVGEKKAREIWYFCRQYTAQEALEMGLVNKVVPLEELDREVDKWCEEIFEKSPRAIKFLKFAFNADTDHMYGIENLSTMAVRMYWETDEAMEAKISFKEKRKPDFSKFL